MEPAHAASACGEDRAPVEVAGLELRRCLVRPIVEHYGRAHTLAAIAVDRGHIGAVDAVVLEELVEWLHAHRFDALGDQIADGIIHHCRGDARLQAKTIGQIRGAVELAAADVNLTLRRFAEWHNARIETMYQRAKRDKIQRAFWFDVQTIFHLKHSLDE